jgi:hypothetical protein
VVYKNVVFVTMEAEGYCSVLPTAYQPTLFHKQVPNFYWHGYFTSHVCCPFSVSFKCVRLSDTYKTRHVWLSHIPLTFTVLRNTVSIVYLSCFPRFLMASQNHGLLNGPSVHPYCPIKQMCHASLNLLIIRLFIVTIK